MLNVAIVCLLSWISPTLSDREHKVHNIVLYPERHSWCQTTPIKQVVALPGYESMTIDNNVCVGACYSYSIPKTQPAEPGELIGPYCDSCQPVDTKCYHVNLKADEKNEDGPRTIQKRVQIITNCTCLSCGKVQTTDCDITDESTAELPPNLFAILYGNSSLSSFNSSYDDVKELMNLPKDRTDAGPTATNMKEEQRTQLKMKVVQRLKQIIETNEAKQENNVLQQLVSTLENPKADVSSKNLITLFNSINGEDKDVATIKEIMLGIKRDQDLLEKHRNFGLGNYVVDIDTAKKNSDINRNLEQHMGKTYNVKGFGSEGGHTDLGSYKGNHIAIDVPETPAGVNSISEEIRRTHHHHFVGEVQTVGLETGHLAKGPHDSLVLLPNVKVEKKLHIESDDVKPNQEGVVVEYKNHPRDSHLVHI